MRHARDGAQAEYYRQFSFQPAINPRSRQMAQVRAARNCETLYCKVQAPLCYQDQAS